VYQEDGYDDGERSPDWSECARFEADQDTGVCSIQCSSRRAGAKVRPMYSMRHDVLMPQHMFECRCPNNFESSDEMEGVFSLKGVHSSPITDGCARLFTCVEDACTRRSMDDETKFDARGEQDGRGPREAGELWCKSSEALLDKLQLGGEIPSSRQSTRQK
jgi:hypothetical protein